MSTEKQIEANRRNAQKSTGPRTTEGKAASRGNAVKHGLTAEQIAIIPGEDAGAFNSDLLAWYSKTDGDPFCGPLAETGCRASWLLRRLAALQDARICAGVAAASDRFDIDQARRAHELGVRLFASPQNCLASDPEGPAAIVAELRTFAAGVDWMIDRWTDLDMQLDALLPWDHDARLQAVQLMGKPSAAIIYDPQLIDLMLACLAVHPDPNSLRAPSYQDSIASGTRSVHFYQGFLDVENVYTTPEAGFAALKDLVSSQIERLRARRDDDLAERTEAERASATLSVLFENGPEADKMRRYEVHLTRTLRQCIEAILKLRRAAHQEPPRPRREPTPASQVTIGIGQPAAYEPSEWDPGPERPLRNEANPWPVSDPRADLWDRGIGTYEAPPGPA